MSSIEGRLSLRLIKGKGKYLLERGEAPLRHPIRLTPFKGGERIRFEGKALQTTLNQSFLKSVCMEKIFK